MRPHTPTPFPACSLVGVITPGMKRGEFINAMMTVLPECPPDLRPVWGMECGKALAREWVDCCLCTPIACGRAREGVYVLVPLLAEFGCRSSSPMPR